MTEDGKLYYYKNNVKQKGAVKIGDDIYYFSMNYNALADGKYHIETSMLNGLLPAGIYEIKDYKIVVPQPKDGLVTEDGKLYYYVNNVKQKGAVKIGGDIYYFSMKYNALADGKYYIEASMLNGLLPTGIYEIKDHKIVVPQPKQGLVTEDGKLYYYDNNVKQKGAIKIGEDLYYFSLNYNALVNGKYYIEASMLNGYLPTGIYEIKDYKIVVSQPKQGLVTEDGKLYYYDNNVKQKGAIKIGDDIYYFSLKYNALADGQYYIEASMLNGLLPTGVYQIKDYKIVV